MPDVRLTVFVCTGPVCGEPGLSVARKAKALVVAQGWQDLVSVHKEVCLGYCHQGPNVMLCAQADAWGRAPLAGSPGTQTLHGVDEAVLRAKIAEALARNPPSIQNVRNPENGAKG